MLLNNKLVAITLAGYFSEFKNGTLNNEPARLLCEFFENELDIDEIQEPVEAITDWLNRTQLNLFGNDGSLGGARITCDIENDIVEYGRGENFTWLTADALIELAEEAQRTGEHTPAPEWFESSWMGITYELAKKHIEEMGDAEVLAALERRGVQTRYGKDENLEFRLGQDWTKNPRAALIDWIESDSPERLAELLMNS